MDDSNPDKQVDPERPHRDAPFDRDQGYSGQDFSRTQERAMGDAMHSVDVDPHGGIEPPPAKNKGKDLPPENGRRAFVDDATGEVHGSGMGAGGGQMGEDIDDDAATGGG